MIIYTNEKLIKRNARIAQVSMIGGLAVLAGGMVISFRDPARYFNLSLIALALGFILSQVGIYYTNRFGRKPRPDQLLNLALKGLDSKYAVFHYITSSSHVLVGPSGIWVLLPRYQRGVITYSKGRIRQRGGGVLQSYLKIFAQEGLGRPELDVQNEKESLKTWLTKNLPEDSKFPDIQAALVFTNPSVQIDIPEDAELPAETVILARLKDVIRKSAKAKVLSAERAKAIQDYIAGEETIMETEE
jgi:hypothetical protein